MTTRKTRCAPSLHVDTQQFPKPYFVLVAQSQLFPQLHSLLSFIGQFLPLFLHVGASAAKAATQMAEARIENRIFV